MQRLADPPYLAFPFRIERGEPATSGRSAHVSEQIEQVLLTVPSERVFRSEFGAGIHAQVFEPNNHALEELTENRLVASLAEALQGEVDPKTLRVQVRTAGDGEQLLIVISYTLATIGHKEERKFLVSRGGGGSV